MLFSRSTSAEVAATVPTEACPLYHRTIAQPVTETISAAFSSDSARSIFVTMRISDMNVDRACSIASFA